MQGEEYFEFEKFETKFGPVERIRIKGHRVAVERVLDYYKQGDTAETIVEYLPTLTVEKVKATIDYYKQHQTRMEEYLRRGEEVADAYYQEYLTKGPLFLKEDALGQCAGQSVAGGLATRFATSIRPRAGLRA